MANWTQQRHLQYERHNNSLHGQPFLPPSQPNKSSTLRSSTTKSRSTTLNNCNNIKYPSFQLSDQHTIPNIFTKFYRHNFDSSTVGLLAFTCIITALSHSALGEGNVGCKFVRTLCLDNSEVCYDDNVFGKCIPTTGINVEDIERTPLTEDQSHLLSTMLEEMQGDGLGWDHPYVQCRIQGTLFSLEKQTPLPPNLCSNLAPIPKAKDRVGSMASVRFAPSSEPTDYGMNQFYYPPLKKQYFKTNDFNEIFQNDFNDYVDEALPNDVNRFAESDKYRESQMNQPSGVDVFMRKELDTIRHKDAERKLKAEAQRKAALRHNLKLYQSLADTEPDPQPFLRHRQTLDASDSDVLPSVTNFAPSKRKQESVFRELVQQQHVEPKALDSSNSNNQPTKTGFESSARKRLTDTNNFNLDESLLRNSLTPFEEEAILFANIYPNRPKYDDSTHPYEKLFSEGGPFMIAPGDHNKDTSRYNRRKEIAREFFANMLGFIRHERLDVKKPGPLIGPPSLVRGDIEEQQVSQTNTTKEDLPKQHLGSEGEAKKKKKLVVQHSDEDHGPHSVDTEYAHVLVKNSIENWSDGVRIMNELASILHLQGYLTYLTVQPHEISFRVDSNNPEHRTASDVAQSINENRGVKNNILRRLGVTVVGAGVGDKVKRDDDNGVSASRLELGDKSPNVTSIMIYMFAGAGAAAIVVICITLILISRHDRQKREKLTALKAGAMAGGDNCSKDYQELCRARMAKKNSTSEPVSSGRITSLSKENERPPSSRSSTSSWCEEPALTNMDISTGHMVLSYMEDHLRNKGRLQREWEALCRYEAEPNAREMALQPQCSKLNRPGAPLPYDHSRVVLNHLANAEGLDYINASTITDHDPRAPAYIAAQGPLPSTLAHFWQMVWEQGAVVIVALCRLQENGDIACVRYWPEEGAEVYHIYEVHLVSEHIWCDDYLVRSFYLKNLRTSETRTVTQFHFLSWPLGGVPLQAKALLDFRRKVNKSYRGRSCPIVVHGSNGAGRTGAYILLDMVLGRMNKGAREIDIAATLEHLRDQRADLVATRQQFEFVLMAVAEEVHAILKALPPNTTNNDKRDLEIRGEQNVLKEEESDENVVKEKQIDKEKENKTEPVKQKGDNKKI